MELWQSTMENMVINQTFWKNKKVLLTGHTGFKGSWLSLWLQKLGSDVIGFSRDIPTKPSLFELCNVADNMVSIMGNICDIEHLRTVMTEHKPEIVIHMAAQSLVGRSYDDPLETFSTNVLGTVNVFEVIRKLGNVRVVINVTSDKCYENRESISGYKETDPMGGYDPYSSSKGCAELITSSFRNSFFNPKEYDKHGIALASVRAGNIIGGGDWSTNRLVPDIMKGLIENQTVTIRNPSSVRPWQFVLEPLRGYLMLAEKLWHEGPQYVEGWNFG
ncbi:MAG: CDP-glucose 4,6-dehydratase, partial [Nitrosotalea sp.]